MMEGVVNLVFVNPWPFWAGGVVIGLLVPLLYYYFNTALGVSTGYGNLVKIIFRPYQLNWIKSNFADTWNWRMFFILGIILGGFISARLSGMPILTMEMGSFTRIVGWPVIPTGIYFFSGGILLGLGARIAGGCTSGHSIHGIANMHISSIIATVMFLMGGIVAANFISILFM